MTTKAKTISQGEVVIADPGKAPSVIDNGYFVT